MKKILCVMTLSLTLVVGACSSTESSSAETDPDKNLLNVKTLNDEGWINFDGEVSSSENEMVYTDSISYIPDNKYILNDSAYVSYFKDDEFIKTVLHDGENPINIEKIKEANNIKVSFSNKKSERIKLEEK